MTKGKKILAGGIAAVLICAGSAGAVIFAKKANVQEILVVPVESIYSESYQATSSLSGTITTSVSQNVKLDDEAIIQEVYVKKGDRVKKGDKLLTLDMTLKELELDIAKLTKESQELQLKKAEDRLESLKNGGSIEEETNIQITPDPTENTSSGTDQEEKTDGEMSAAAQRTKAQRAVSMSYQGTKRSMIFLSGQNLVEEDGESIGEEETALEPEDEDSSQIEEIPEDIVFYSALDYDSQPYSGEGTREDPFVFLCSRKEKEVIIKGSFFNKMAGFDAQGQTVENQGGYWFCLGFFDRDQVGEEEDMLLSETFKGSSFPLQDPEKVNRFSIEGMQFEKQEDEEEDSQEDDTLTVDPDIDSEDGYVDEEEPQEETDTGSSVSREEAIEQQQTTIDGLKLDIKESEIKISKLEKEVAKKTITSTIDGTVKNVGDPDTGSYSGNGFITIDSDEGYYVQGTVSELQRDLLQPGQTISGIAYESGNVFAAVIDEVSDYPVASQSYYNTGNTNVSYYSFLAEIPDTSVQLKVQEYVNLTVDAAMENADGSIQIAKAFVITEDGQDYVYKDADGVLKKVPVTVGTSQDGGYSVSVSGDLTLEDKLAFPYGKGVKEGAKTKEGSIDDLYGIY